MTVSATNQGLKPGVCTSTSRPTSPFDGMMIYETDTNLVRIWNGTAWKTLAYSDYTNGTLLQVVSSTYSTAVTSSSNTYVDTGLTASITPLSTTSKVLVCVNQNGCLKQTNNTAMLIRLYRNGTDIHYFARLMNTDSTITQSQSASTMYLDSPSSTSSVTYKTQFMSANNNASVTVQWDSVVSTITLMEIAG